MTWTWAAEDAWDGERHNEQGNEYKPPSATATAKGKAR